MRGGLYKQESAHNEIIAHNAKGDVEVLRYLFLHLLKEGHTIQKLIELTQTPILYERFAFGKYKEEPIKEVVLKDMAYCEYLLNNVINDPDLIYSINHHIKTQKAHIIHRFSVGKYKGQSVDEIDDMNYLKWAFNHMTNMSSGLKNQISQKLNIQNLDI